MCKKYTAKADIPLNTKIEQPPADMGMKQLRLTNIGICGGLVVMVKRTATHERTLPNALSPCYSVNNKTSGTYLTNWPFFCDIIRTC